MGTIHNLKQRKLIQWTLAYCAGAWALLQFLDFLASNFGWSDTFLRIITVVFGFGIGAVLIIAWYHGDRGAQRASALELVLLAILAIGAGTSAFAVGHRTVKPAAARSRDDGSIAIVPFRNLSQDSAQENFTEGFTDELSTTLAGEGLSIVAPSAFTFDGPEENVRKVARELSVRYLLEGSVMRAATQVRINTRLVTPEDSRQVWAGRYEAVLSPGNLLHVQGEIAREIVAALRLRLVPNPRRSTTPGTENQEAYDAYLRGLGALAQVTREGNESAAKAFGRAVELDPSFARAHSGLAFANYGWWKPLPDREKEMVATATRAARRALALDSTLSEPHVVFAMIAEERGDTIEQRRQLEAAIRKEPTAGWPHYFMGVLQFDHGNLAGTLAQADTLLALDPTSSWNHIRATNLRTVAGEFALSDSSAARAEQLIAMGFGPQPTWALYWNRGTNALMRGDYAAAADYMARGFPEGNRLGVIVPRLLGGVAAAQRGPGSAQERQQAMLRIVDRYADSVGFSFAFTLYRQLDSQRMWAYLEQTLRTEGGVNPVSWEFQPLRAEPRFRDLLARYAR